MSYLNHVKRTTKGVCHVYLTPSGTLRAILQVRGNKRTKIEDDTQEGAERLIKWINQNHFVLTNSGLLPDLETLRGYKVSDIIDWYKDHPAPKKNPKAKLSKVDLSHLNRLEKDAIAKVSLADESILISAAHDYKDKRLSGNEIPSVEREITLFKAMFNKARKACALGLANIPNPFQGIQFDYDQEDYSGTRSELSEEDERRIIHALETDTYGPNKYYAPLAFIIELHTGMRPDELFSVRHKDCDTITRRINIPNRRRTEGKGKPRSNWTIPMSPMVQLLLLRLSTELISLGTYNPNALVFPPSDRKNRHGKQAEGRQEAFQTVFERRVEALGLNEGREKRDRLTFRSLRRIARCRFEYDIGLNPDECQFMLGHSMRKRIDRTHYDNKGMMSKAIQDKLDRYYLKGKTLDEMRQDLIEKGWREVPGSVALAIPEEPSAEIKSMLRECFPAMAARLENDAALRAMQADAGAMGSKLYRDDEGYNRNIALLAEHRKKFIGQHTLIKDLPFEGRTKKILREHGVHTLGHLIRLSDEDILNMNPSERSGKVMLWLDIRPVLERETKGKYRLKE